MWRLALNLNRREVCARDHNQQQEAPTEKELEFNMEEYWRYVDQVQEMKRESGSELFAEVEERIKEVPPRYCPLSILESRWDPDESTKYSLVDSARGLNLLQKGQSGPEQVFSETEFKNLSDEVEVMDYDFRKEEQADPYQHQVFGDSLNAFNYYDRSHIKKHLPIMRLPAPGVRP